MLNLHEKAAPYEGKKYFFSGTLQFGGATFGFLHGEACKFLVISLLICI